MRDDEYGRLNADLQRRFPSYFWQWDQRDDMIRAILDLNRRLTSLENKTPDNANEAKKE